jgi:hypothetical protein
MVSETIEKLNEVSHCDFEIVVVSEPASEDDAEKSLTAHKSDVRYFENKKYLGYPRSLIKLFDIADGDYVLLSSDEDFILPDSVPWIIETVRENDDVTMIIGKPENKGGEDWDIEPGWYEPPESVKKFFFKKTHLTGNLIKVDPVELSYGRQFADESETPLGAYIHLVFSLQATLAGRTLYTDRCTWRYGPDQISEHEVDYASYQNKALRCSTRASRIIPDLIDDPELRSYLVDKERKTTARIFLKALQDSPSETPGVLGTFIATGAISRSSLFWSSLPNYVIKYMKTTM